MTDPRHLLDYPGACLRCGLPLRASPYCPPGFWMTHTETRDWCAASDEDRVEMEKAMIFQRMHSDEPRS